jgi:putative oxidoreductase
MSTIVQSQSSASRTAATGNAFTRALASRSEAAFAAMRIVVGLAFGFHGLQGLFGIMIPAEYVPALWSQGWFGSVIELATGAAIAAGAFTRYAAFLASGTMAVAYIQFHWKFAFDSKFFPAANQGEPALIYCFLFLYIACRGAGIFSVDAARNPLNAKA